MIVTLKKMALLLAEWLREEGAAGIVLGQNNNIPAAHCILIRPFCSPQYDCICAESRPVLGGGGIICPSRRQCLCLVCTKCRGHWCGILT